ncbi:MAG: SLC13 family permease [Melioribacter sp.]|uniref:SLC13 family permease n=1 Tax=Rosettibacter primus TaxID=3111523 RepID=UPI00247CE9FD|nr:SLC13 family permease [Melioribacter sp.]
MNRKTVSQLIWLGIGICCAVCVLYFLDFGEKYKDAQIVASIAVLMSILWITEAVPLAVTSLIPLILFPITGVISSKDISQSYINSTIFLFMGGFIIAIAMERWNLHKRIALNVIEITGKSPSKIILGFMASSALISMWISNTATAVMLLPIGLSIIYKLEEEFGNEKTSRFAIALMLGIAYSCSIGGIATPIGTPPNLVFQRIYKINFPNNPEIYFGDWMKFAAPISLVMIVFVWLFLTKVLFRNYNFTSIEMNLIKEEKLKLGGITYEEKIVAIIFLITSLLWIFRAELDLGFIKIPGWSQIFLKPDFIDDGTVAITMAFLLYIIPVSKKSKEQNFILDFNSIKKIPWDIILLFGGGFALADGFVASKLSILIGQQFTSLKNVEPIFLIVSVCFVLTFLTELTSNTATAQIILPILASLSIELNLNPLLLMIPATISSSFAFMLPVATPPNAIVFSSRKLKIIDMARVGLIINFFGIITVTFFVWLFFV